MLCLADPYCQLSTSNRRKREIYRVLRIDTGFVDELQKLILDQKPTWGFVKTSAALVCRRSPLREGFLYMTENNLPVGSLT